MQALNEFVDEPRRLERAVFGENVVTQESIAAIKPPVAIRNSSQFITNLYSGSKSSKYISSVFCMAYPNLANVSVMFDQPPSVWEHNYTVFGIVPSMSFGQYIDWKEANAAVHLDSLGRLDFEQPVPPRGPPVPYERSMLPWAKNPLWMRMLLPNPPQDGFWSIPTIPGIGIGLTYNRIRYNLTTSSPLFICTIGQFIDMTITPFLVNLKPTANTVAMLVDSNNLMVSASISGAAANMTHRFKVNESPDPLLAGIGAAVLQKIGTFAAVPNGWSSMVVVNGKKYFLKASNLAITPLNLTLLIAIPRSDFFANIDNANKNSAIVTACVAVFVTVMGVAAFMLLSRPLRTLTSGMEQITKFDFSILNTGILKHRSVIKEYREMEIVFDTMCKAFAGAIRRNKALISTTHQQSMTGSEARVRGSSVSGAAGGV